MLTDTGIRNAKPTDRPYKVADRNGLCVQVKPNGTKLWLYRYRLHGKSNQYSIGRYPDVSLAEARDELQAARKLVQAGINPTHRRKQKRAEEALASANTFSAVADEWIGIQSRKWTPSYTDTVSRRMKEDVYPKIGKLPISKVKAIDLLAILKAVERRGAETVALHIRMWVGAVFRHAIATLRADFDPTQALRGAIHRPKVRHRQPLAQKDIPQFLARLDSFKGYEATKICLNLLLLLFCRPSELRRAEWAEFDLVDGLWRVPAHRMKTREPHVIPLSDQAVDLLRRLQQLTGNYQFLFPNQRRPKDHMADGTLNRALARMNYQGRFSAHGFRATASTILNEMGYRPDVIERQLAHQDRNLVRRSYNQAIYLDERRQMLQNWADFIDTLRT